MSTTEAQAASPDPRLGKVKMNLEVHVIPVSDVDRSKQFYERLGWRLDDEAAHRELVGGGIDASDLWHGPPFPPEARQCGVDPERASYGSFFSFNDPDGNLWLVQEITTRRPGREWED
jgi:hypothetical protein